MTDLPATSHWGDQEFVNLVYAGFMATIGNKDPEIVEFHDHAAAFLDFCQGNLGVAIDEAARHATWLSIYLKVQGEDVYRIIRDVGDAIASKALQ